MLVLWCSCDLLSMPYGSICLFDENYWSQFYTMEITIMFKMKIRVTKKCCLFMQWNLLFLTQLYLFNISTFFLRWGEKFLFSFFLFEDFGEIGCFSYLIFKERVKIKFMVLFQTYLWTLKSFIDCKVICLSMIV